ncbi:MAG: hypothetical protein IJJ69_06810 [Oscillospiraceae bacterium]|nr:hypothetical protein [Oscillospiraceae bacterium]
MKTATQPKKKITIRTKIYLFVIIFGLMNIFSPLVAHADIFGFEVQDIYATITENVKETNEILQKAFTFSQTSPYDVVNSLDDTSSGTIAIAVRNASKTMALVVATLLLMVDFFKKTVNFEWSSKWENILLFLIKIIVMKQIVQNADVIIGYIYAGFNSINKAATNTSIDFLPYGTAETYTWVDEDGIITKMFKKGWWDYFYDLGAGQYRTTYTYLISQDAVKIFYPNATFNGTDLNANPLANPTTALLMPTLEVVLLQPYFLVIKAIAYIIFVIVIGRVFELSIYTIFAPLPLATFASETSHDVAKNFIKNYIATVLQIAVIVIMFLIYAGMTKYIANLFPTTKMLQIIILISLGLGVVKSGAWSKKICGIG